jgi:hypothetical protein
VLYIEDTDGSQWLVVVALLRERALYDMVLSLYPEAGEDEIPDPFEAPDVRDYLEPVTEYPDDVDVGRSARLRVSPELIDDLRQYLGEFEDWGDALILYPLKEQQWVAAYVPARRVVLIRDIRLYDFLDAGGLTVSVEEPDGS